MNKIFRSVLIIFSLIKAPIFSMEVSSQVFFDLNMSTQKGVFSAFHIRRAYLDFKEQISDNVSFRLTTDAGTSTTDGRMNIYIKMANIIWSTTIGDFIVGPQLTNYFGPSKKTWGYRFIEKFPGHLYGFDETADLGISWKKYFSSFLVHIGIYNGTGFKKPDDDQYKKISLLLSHGEQNLQIHPGRNWGVVFALEPYPTSFNKVFSTVRLGGFAGYGNESFRLGAEYHIENDSGMDHQERILSLYSSFAKTKTLSLVGRIDLYDSSVGHPEMRKNVILIGLSYNPSSNFQVSPNARYIFYNTNMLESYWVSRLSFNYKF
ncbi:MAG: hypothetical protein CMG75_00550 [Candidatus Marinimicrobia bacterium]|nr:hypothetical protein [Candidatus Neomarinimicrobiota bacterium]